MNLDKIPRGEDLMITCDFNAGIGNDIVLGVRKDSMKRTQIENS